MAEIGGRSTRLMPLWEIQELLAAAPGTKIELELIRLGEPQQVTFELRRFDAAGGGLERVEGTALLRIPSFARRDRRPGARGARGRSAPSGELLVDLRGVAGGDAEAAYEVAELFARGELGALLQKGERKRRLHRRRARRSGRARSWCWSTAAPWAPAEVLATVLRQKAAAELVGEPTFGHAGRQARSSCRRAGACSSPTPSTPAPTARPIDDGLEPDLLVDERSRTFLEKDTPIEELILRRGLRHLRGEDEEAKAAA